MPIASTISSGALALVLLAKALDPNPSLQSYTAAATLVAQLHSVVPVRETLHGTATYQKPVQRIVFNDVPEPLRRFADLVQTVPTYPELAQNYHIVPGKDDGTVTMYALTPVAADRRVSKVLLTVDDAKATITSVLYSYTDGSQLALRPKYQLESGYLLAQTLDIRARFPGYSVDGTLTLTDFRF